MLRAKTVALVGPCYFLCRPSCPEHPTKSTVDRSTPFLPVGHQHVHQLVTSGADDQGLREGVARCRDVYFRPAVISIAYYDLPCNLVSSRK